MDHKQLENYNRVRHGVGLFDFSSNSKIFISGNDSTVFLNKVISGEADNIMEGRIINTLFLRENGSILAIVWLLKDEERFIIITDSTKRTLLWKWLLKYSEGYDVKIEDNTDKLGILAIMGPRAMDTAMRIGGDDIIGLPYLGFEHNEISDCLICRIGHTGEYEYHFLMPKERCREFAEQILSHGQEYDIASCRNEIIDVLMLEMRSVNQNKDIPEDVCPIQAGLHWMVDFSKEYLLGREFLMQEKKSPHRKLMALIFETEVEIPENAELYIEDIRVGFLVNQAFSPTMKKTIALAYIEERFGWVGIDFDVEALDKSRVPAKTVSSPLFLTRTIEEAGE
jgi:aminomethyltransferase